MLLARMGLRDEAAAELERAHKFGPKDGFTSFHTACVHVVLGNPTDALEALSTAQVRGYCIRSEQRNSEFRLPARPARVRQADQLSGLGHDRR
jgi:hypothetical protein